METIKSWVYNPKNSIFQTSKNDRAKAFYKMCSNKENCTLYKGKRCVLLNLSGLFGHMSCIYGKTREIEGFTPRANNFYSWIIEKEKESCGKDIKETGKGIFEVGEYYLFVFNFLNNFEFSEDAENSKLFKKYQIIKKELFNIDIANKFINFIPRSLFGGPIKDYHKKEIPLFLEGIKYKFPEIYIKIREEIKNKYIVNNIGRKAYIKTMVVGSILKDRHGNEYVWNGKSLICENYRLSFNFSKGKTKIESEILDSETYEIRDEQQVNENTMFKD